MTTTTRISLATLLAAVPALAHAALMPVMSVPTLDEWGLIGLAVGVGSLGAWMVSRKK